MLIWLFLFFIVVAISFILALRSMRDFWDSPADLKITYSLYLIRNPQGLTTEILNDLHQRSLKEGFIFSLEKLFKGEKKALVIFGPANILKTWGEVLSLLELEDYSLKVDMNHIQAWEVGWKVGETGFNPVNESSSVQIDLNENEQFWWQVVVRPIKRDQGEKKAGVFQVVLRAIVISENKERTKQLRDTLGKIGSKEGLAALPQAYSTNQIIGFYQKRALQTKLPGFVKDKAVFCLESEKILSLLRLIV